MSEWDEYVEPPREEGVAVPAKHIEAERAAFGAMLLNPEAIDIAIDILGGDGEVFAEPQHQAIYKAIVALHSRGVPCDLVTLHNYFERTGTAEDAGGMAYVGSLQDIVQTSSGVAHYAGIVKDESVRRRVAAVCHRVAANLRSGAGSSKEILAELDQEITAISQGQEARHMVHVNDALPDVIREIEERRKGGGAISGIATGFPALDNLMLGLRPGTLNIIAARPSVGKSAMAANIAYNAAKAGHPVLFFSLEMQVSAVVRRLVCIDQDVNFKVLCSDFDITTQNKRIRAAALSFTDKKIYVDDSSRLGLWQFRSRARAFARKFSGQMPLLIVDYLQLLDLGAAGRRNRYEAVGEATREAKILAGELACPIVLLSQLGREADSLDDPFRALGLLRESGNIEQDSDAVIAILRRPDEGLASIYNQHKNELKLDAQYICNAGLIKNRDGATGRVAFYFEKPTQRMDALDDYIAKHKQHRPTQTTMSDQPYIPDTFTEDPDDDPIQ